MHDQVYVASATMFRTAEEAATAFSQEGGR
jgi:hypothetical protein